MPKEDTRALALDMQLICAENRLKK